MGNFSRNTFQPSKNYVGVRLQQGVPLVDADWNEQNDVIRQDLYNGLGAICPDGVAKIPNTALYALTVAPTGTANDFQFAGGTAIVGGRPTQLAPQWFLYSAQPWATPAIATRDGVAVIPPLTTPGAARTDLVYADVWEREVGQAEDSAIVNPIIGVETAVRLKREVAIRVAEGAAALPAAPAGHRFMLISVLNRPANAATILDAQIEERRSFIAASPATQVLSVEPAFAPLNVAGWSPWLLELSHPKTWAHKPTSNAFVLGVVPVALPHGAKLISFQFQVRTVGTGSCWIGLIRTSVTPDFGASATLGFDTSVSAAGTFVRTVAITAQGRNQHIVDNANFAYSIYAQSTGSAFDMEIHGLSITYEY